MLTPAANAPHEQFSYVDVLPFAQRWDYGGDGTRRSIEDSLAIEAVLESLRSGSRALGQ